MNRFLALFSSLFLINALFAQDSLPSYTVVEDESQLQILNPTLSQRKTAKIVLKNGIRLYLISDPETKQSGASVCVETGSWDDPKEHLGMAHFLEHMLFMGTGAYPEEQEFMKYVQDADGIMNAYTAEDRTVYMFSVKNPAFSGALDRFGHFFIDPLLLRSAMNREKCAVDQEHAKNIENDLFREYMVLKELSQPHHPHSQFSTGNSQTFINLSPEAMKQWYETHYDPQKMHVVVLARANLEELTRQAVDLFSQVPQRNCKKTNCDFPIFPNESKGQLICIEPITKMKRLSLMWELPDWAARDREIKPASLLTFVLASKTSNSLEAALKQENWAESLSVMQDRASKGHLLLQIDIDLTDQGLANTDQVISLVFQTLSSLKQTGLPQSLFSEVNEIANWQYSYQTRTDCFNFLKEQAALLMYEDFASYPKKTLFCTIHDPQVTAHFINTLNADSCIFVLKAPLAESDKKNLKKEKWVGVEYVVKPIAKTKLRTWNQAPSNSGIGLPANNPYLPKDFAVLHTLNQNAKERPKLLINDLGAQIYHCPDYRYAVPRTSLVFNFKSPLLDGSAESIALLDLYLKAVEEELSSDLFFAQNAGLECSFHPVDLGATLYVYGFSDKIHTFFQKIIQTSKNPSITAQKFAIYKHSLLDQYDNSTKKLAFFQGQELAASLLFDTRPKNADKFAALESISFEQFQQFASNLFKMLYVQGMIYGNLTEQQARELYQTVPTTFRASPYKIAEQQKRHVLLLPEGKGPYKLEQTISMQGNAALLVIEGGEASFTKRAVQQILAKVLANGFFDTLRTKQQTAYIAKTWPIEEEGQQLQVFGVQSNTHQPDELIVRFELYLENLVKNIYAEIPKERFDTLRQMSILQCKTPPNNPLEMSQMLWSLAFEREADFDYMEKRITTLETLDYEKFVEHAQNFLDRENTKRLALLIEGVIPEKNRFRYQTISSPNLQSVGKYVSFEHK